MSGAFEPAPVAPEGLARTLAEFGDSRMLPPEAYTSEDVFRWEMKNFFRGWQCIGRSEDIAEGGMQRAERLGDTSVLLVRRNDGVLRAFANTCRHRGHELLPCGGSRTARRITCPYHAWTYSLDGDLIGASVEKPGNWDDQSEAPFDMADFGLRSLAVEEWHGWVFLDASGTAGPLSEHLAGLEERVGQYRPETLRVGGRHEYVVKANWKGIIENYQECYHCSSIHPELCRVSPPDSGENWTTGGGAWVGGYLDLRPHAVTMSLDGTSSGVAIAGLNDTEQRRVDYIGVFPNLLISLHPDYVMTHRMVPLSPGETWVECLWTFPQESFDREGFEPSYAIDFWDITNREDWDACESVQRGLSSGMAEPGPLSPSEDAVYQFVTMVARGYLGLPLGTPANAS